MSQGSIFNPLSRTLRGSSAQNISSIDPKLSRTHYYDGRLLKAADLIRDQLYLDERLREVGRALGHGIVRGLDIQLSDAGMLTVSPGIGVASSGRVLELENRSLSINLYDNALIASLNPGFRRLERGLYAVVIQYAEAGKGSAEVYPRDLEGERGFHFNAYSEGVEISLSPLRIRLPSSRSNDRISSNDRINSSIHARSAMVRELIGNPSQPKELPEDGLALGVLSIENGRPSWIDHGLLRRPHRPLNAPNRLQLDLHTHYQELLSDVMLVRQQSVRQQEFPAAHYFSIMPPYGSVPRDAINPELGRQGYFPKGYEVSIAPVREDDLEAILAQSVGLEAIDLARDKDVDIMLLVPMTDHQFAWRARQLEHEISSDDHTQLAHLDNLALRLYDSPDVHQANTDAAVWRAIWAETSDLLYVRRPTRVAETHVSAVVLAAGYGRPTPGTAVPPDISEIERERDQLAAQITRLEQRILDIEEQLAQDPDDRLTEAQTLITTLEAEIVALNARLVEAAGDRAIITELTSERDALRTQLTAAEAEIATLRANDVSDTALQAQITNLTNQLAEANRTIAALRNQGSGAEPIDISTLVRLRGVRDRSSAGELEQIIGSDQIRLGWVNQAAILFGREYDPILWRTLLDVAQNRNLRDFIETISSSTNTSLGQTVIQNGSSLGVSDQTLRLWVNFEELRNDGIRNIDIAGIDRLNRLGDIPTVRIEELANNRSFTNTNAVANLSDALNNNDNSLTAVNQISALVEPRYEEALWATLPTLARNDNTEAFRDYLVEATRNGLPLGTAVAARSNTLRLTPRQRALWADADLTR